MQDKGGIPVYTVECNTCFCQQTKAGNKFKCVKCGTILNGYELLQAHTTGEKNVKRRIPNNKSEK